MSHDKLLGQKRNISVLYIGSARYEKLAEIAIHISYRSNCEIKTSDFARYIIDNFMDQAIDKLLTDIKSQAEL